MPRLACARSCASARAHHFRACLFFSRALWVQLQKILNELGYQPSRPFDVTKVLDEILDFVWDRKFYTLEYPLSRIDRAPWLRPNYDFSSEHIFGSRASRNFDALGGSRMDVLAHLIAYVESGGTAGLDTEEAIALAIQNAEHVFPAFTVISSPPPASEVGKIYVCVRACARGVCVCRRARFHACVACARASVCGCVRVHMSFCIQVVRVRVCACACACARARVRMCMCVCGSARACFACACSCARARISV
jgi:hypothetical protein